MVAVAAAAPAPAPRVRLLRASPDECPRTGGTPSADSLVRTGRYWHASRIAPPPRGTRLVPADSLLLPIAIAEGLHRFNEVDALIARARGGDSSIPFLLTAARADERAQRWRNAELKYRKALALQGDNRAAAPRLAGVLEQQGLRDSAIAAWRRAAQAYPEIADWFAVRRANLESDTAIAFAAVSGARTPGALRASQLLIAQRRLNAGNAAASLDLFARVGRPLDVARVEFVMGQRRTARARADTQLFRDPSNPINPNALLAATFLTERFDTLSLAENIAISRAYRARGDRATAIRYARDAVARGRALRPDTSLAGWLELARLEAEGRNLGPALRAVDSAGARAGRRRPAVIAAARIMVYLLADHRDMVDSLTPIVTRVYPGDSSVARTVMALADRDRAAGAADSERIRYSLLLRRFPDAPATNIARFRAALMAYAAGDRDSARTLMADALARDSLGALGTGPRYWNARLKFERGDTGSVATLRAIAAASPISFYGTRAREILGDSSLLSDSSPPLPRLGTFPPARARDRLRLLTELGLDAEARLEATGWASDTTVSVWVLIGAASAAAEAGYARESIALGDAARARVGMTLAVARALFPYSYRPVIESEAGEICVDPLLLAAIIRQESRFDPMAVSRVGARGIAQIMPYTGQDMTRRLNIGPWDPQLLFVPDFNLHLSARYVRDRAIQDSFPTHALLASYNAGPARVIRWRRWPEYEDPDLFVERVSISETNSYVRTVYASYVWYRQAYPPQPVPDSRPPALQP